MSRLYNITTPLQVDGQITSTVETGTSPLLISSTTNVSNLNASSLSGATFGSPGSIGSGTPGTGAFTTLGASGITSITNATSSTTTGTGSLVVTGGVGIGENLHVGSGVVIGGGLSALGTYIESLGLNTTDVTNSTSSITGTIKTAGGIGIVKDAHIGGNTYSTNFVQGYVTTATAAGTSTLVVTSAQQQYFTGTTTQTIILPVTSTLTLGHSFTIINNSTGALTVQSSGSNTIQVIIAESSLVVTCILTTGTTAASWSSNYSNSLDLSSPGPIGGTTPSTGNFTTLFTNSNLASAFQIQKTGVGNLFSVDTTNYNVRIDGNLIIDATDNSPFLIRKNDNSGDMFKVDTVSELTTIDTRVIIDNTSTEALLVRKNADGGDVFSVDTSNGRVGIGSTTPQYPLDVVGDIRGTGVLRIDGSIRIQTGTNNGLNFLDSGAGISIEGYDQGTLGGVYRDISMIANDIKLGVGYSGTQFAIHIDRDGGNVGQSNVVRILPTKESTSSSTGALVVSGGVGVAKKLRVGGEFLIGNDTIMRIFNLTGNNWFQSYNITSGLGAPLIFSDAGGATLWMQLDNTNLKVFYPTRVGTQVNLTTSTGGALNLAGDLVLGETNPRIYFPTGAADLPTFTNRSVGTKIVLWSSISASSVDYAIGVGSGGGSWCSVPTTSNSFTWYGGTTEVMKLSGGGLLSLFNGTNKTTLSERGLTIRTDNAATFTANNDINDLNRMFMVCNDNATAGIYSQIGMRVNGSGGILVMDQKLVYTATGTGKLVFTLTGAAAGFVNSYDILELNHDQSATINGNLTVSGNTIIDNTSNEAFLVRKNGDAGDVFTVDTTNSSVRFIDLEFYNAKVGANPYINFDAGDSLLYDRASNAFRFRHNSADGFTIGDNVVDCLQELRVKRTGPNPFLVANTAGTVLFKVNTTDSQVSIGPGSSIIRSALSLYGTIGSIDGPSVMLTTTQDIYPVFHIQGHAHDGIWLNFDCYFNGTNDISSHVGSNFRIGKFSDSLNFVYDSGKTQGSNMTLNIGMSMSNTGVVSSRTILPLTTETFDLGSASFEWLNVYSQNAVTVSDRNKKSDIIPETIGLDFIKDLEPSSYIYKSNGAQSRGLIAQDLEKVCERYGIKGLVSKVEKEDGTKEYDYGIVYTQLFSILIKSIQELSEKVIKLEEK
jgi:hypothetical protein